MKMVQILMSTYNGEKYLRQQLDSILSQDYKNISILIRDDGSKDETIKILKEYVEKYSSISYYQGNNIGAIKSFFDLIKKADEKADYFAFSDQDDVWLSDKLSHAIKKLERLKEKIVLYCGKPILVDANLNKIKVKIRNYDITPSFGNALVENICTGCTAVFNREALELVKNHIPSFTVMHDWWFYLSVSCYGKVIYDKDGRILYRQHGENSIGMRGTLFTEFKARIKNFKKAKNEIYRQAEEFRRVYKNQHKYAKLVTMVADYKKNRKFWWLVLRSKEIKRQTKIDNLIFKVLFMIKLR